MTEWEAVTNDFNRDRYGRPLIIPPDGGKPQAYTRCTTYVDCLDDKYNLGKWQQRMTASGVAQRPDLHLRAASLGLQPQGAAEKKAWKRDMDEVAEAAIQAAGASAAATIGTAIHALTEQVDRGQDIDIIPDHYRKHLDAYAEATRGFTPVHIETRVVQDDLKVGGTPDRILRIPGEDKLIIGDVKTGTTEFGVLKMAMQLAVYAHSVHYDVDTGTRTPLGDVNLERGLIVALSADTGECELKWIDIAAGWEAVQVATEVRGWRKRDQARKLFKPYTPQAATPVLPPTPQPLVMITPDTSLVKVIGRAQSVDELVQIWTQADRQGLWTEDHTRLAAKRRGELTQTTAQATA